MTVRNFLISAAVALLVWVAEGALIPGGGLPSAIAPAIADSVVYSAPVQDVDVLENGLVRLAFNRQNGQFEVKSLPARRIMRMYDAGPAFTKDGRTVLGREALRIDTRHESFKDQIGEGEKLIAEYAFRQGTPGFRYELSVYQGKPWVSVTAYLPKGNYQLGDFALIRGKIQAASAFKVRMYLNSGNSSYSDSGVYQLGMRSWSSANVTVLDDPDLHDALGLGFYSFHRASTSVTLQYQKSDEIGVNAAAHYYGYKPASEDLQTESLLLNLNPDPLAILEEWADAAVKVVQPHFLRDTETGELNTWFIYGNKITEEETLRQAKLLRESPLWGYGVKMVGPGEWQLQHAGGDTGDALGSGEDRVDPSAYPHGVKGLIERLHALGLEVNFGANYAYAGLQSSLVVRHVPWLVWTDLSNINFGYPIDYTDPRAQKWLFDIAQRAHEYKVKAWWDDVDGGPARGPLHDPTKIMRFEDIREGIKVLRQALGPDVLIERTCCGTYFTDLGLADRVRTGDDSFALGDFEGIKRVARQLAANYMLHQRFWINNPDAVFVGGGGAVHNAGGGAVGSDPATVAEVRMRLQNQVASGGFITIGENLADLTTERLHWLTLVLPSYGQAARPLDLFLHTPPEIYDLEVKREWGNWHVLMLQNWNDEDKNYHLRFSELGLDAEKVYLVFSFWNQTFVGAFRHGVDLPLGARQGEAYAIREMPVRPCVLSTDMHLTQGGVELQQVRFDESARQLTGQASRHPGAEGHVVVYIPPGFVLASASGPYQLDEQPSGAMIAHLRLQFKEATTSWSMAFEPAVRASH